MSGFLLNMIIAQAIYCDDIKIPVYRITPPRKISRLCWLFIRKGGRTTCTVTGGRQYSADLPQGGLEIPCILRFESGEKEINSSSSRSVTLYTVIIRIER